MSCSGSELNKAVENYSMLYRNSIASVILGIYKNKILYVKTILNMVHFYVYLFQVVQFASKNDSAPVKMSECDLQIFR